VHPAPLLFLVLLVASPASAAESAAAATTPPPEAAPAASGAAATAAPAPPPAIMTDRASGFALTRPASVQDGSILPVTLEAPSVCAEAEGDWLEREVRILPVRGAYQVLLPVPLGTTGTLTLVVRCGHRAARFRIPVHEGPYPESKLTVDSKFSRPPPPRAATEQQAISRAYASGSRDPLWRDAFLRPTAGEESSPYGVRRTFNGQIASRHYGLDYEGKVGDPIIAANDGVVVLAGADYFWTGNCVFVDHGNGLFTVYFHMSKLEVKTGERVKRGQLLGLIGATGRVTGPHLHFGVKLLGQYVSPNDLLKLPAWTTEPATSAAR
jgi:hypothetical protein